jgi:hypothetical protein
MAGTAKYICKIALLLWAISGSSAAAQIGLLASPGTAALDPAVRRWYVPQELVAEHHWRQWSATNYAREPYQRYVSPSIEGDYFYDAFGNFLNQGWLIYNVSQANPEEFGTVLFEAQRFRNWFSEVAVASEQKGQYAYALTISSDLRTTLTPMVLSKPRLDGIQFDFAMNKYRGTFLYAQASAPRGITDQELRRTNSTTLIGGRFEVQIGDFVELGVHSANAHQANSLSEEALLSNWVTGSLTQGQNRTISRLEIALRDDSPDDGVGGAAYFPAGSDIFITYRDGRVDSGREIRFEPVVEGGGPRPGYIEANGNDEIRLRYDFDSASFINRAAADKTEIVKVEFRLVVANDYQVWMTSDRQVNRDGEAVLLLVAQADGNVQDITNLQTVRFEYGLPTATHIFGGNLEIRDYQGFDLYAEYDLSVSYRKYPNVLRDEHRTTSGIGGHRRAPAWMVNASKKAAPFFVFGEAYSMDPLYNTRTFVTTGTGEIEYDSEREGIVELVEDNDDQDRFPDTVRFDWLQGDSQVFPGWDQNNDFVPDINQNDNFVRSNAVPDYEEPFLRFHSDRPEFLFGMDMNNNFWIDQYENDEEPDYPYRRDHRGYNVYGGADLTPRLKVMVGALREQLISSNQQNKSTYALVTYDNNSPRFGRLRFFEMSKLVEDDIPNPLLQWAPDNTLRGGELTKVEDPLLARDTWINQLFVGHNLQSASYKVQTKLNYVRFRQLMSEARRQALELDEQDFFFGVINKASYRYTLGRLSLEPRWKSEFRKQSRSLFALEHSTSLYELFSAVVETRLLRATQLQAGIEYLIFNDFDVDANDFNSITGAFQFTNQSQYLGYSLHALAGLRIERQDFKEREARYTSQTFITIYAGLE